MNMEYIYIYKLKKESIFNCFFFSQKPRGVQTFALNCIYEKKGAWEDEKVGMCVWETVCVKDRVRGEEKRGGRVEPELSSVVGK